MKSNKSGVTVAFNYDKWFEAHTGHDNDVVKVIRCKDCAHWDCSDDESYCDELGIFDTDMNSYCSYAKRKEE